MKHLLNAPLLFIIALFMVNCTGKNEITPVPKKETISIGSPISLPSIQNTPKHNPKNRPLQNIPQTIPNETPKHQPSQISTYGKSYVKKQFKLPKVIKETSGLIKIDNRLWTLNDSGGKATLYQISEKNGQIVKTLKITNARNYDWEDIAYDDSYVYIGDIGNNRGNRTNLRVYKIPRAALRNAKSVKAQIIKFQYSDQKAFKSKPHNNNYDCEAMIANHGKLYLFSKNWQNQKTRLYELSTQAGTHTAQYLSTFDIGGMVTGATLNKELNILLLTTYSKLLSVNIWAFTNHNGKDFFAANKKKLNLKKPLQGQIEGVTFNGNYKAYLSSEAFRKYIFSFDATLYELDFSEEFE